MPARLPLAAPLLLALATVTPAADLHVASDGDDTRDGRSAANAWRTLARIPVAALAPGDRVVLHGTLEGGLTLTASGTADRPITITGADEAAKLLVPSARDGIRIEAASHLVISGLTVVGPGMADEHDHAGIVLAAGGGRRGAGIVIRDVAVSGFRAYGIQLWAEGAGSGFDDVLVERVACADNGQAGLGSWGPCLPGAWAFRRVIVRDSVFHDNRGIPEQTWQHSGSGLLLGDCQDALVERCAAWGNGERCNSPAGGPVGLWLCESDRSRITASVAHHNRTGPGSTDGGGFDLDGGCTGCAITQCLSYANDGAGYLVCQYPGARPLAGNVVCDNVSLHDGRAHRFGAVTLYAAQRDTLIARNTIVISAASGAEPCGLRIDGGGQEGCVVQANLVVAVGEPGFIDLAPAGALTFAANRWLALPLPVEDDHPAAPTPLGRRGDVALTDPTAWSLPATPDVMLRIAPFVVPEAPLPLRIDPTELVPLRVADGAELPARFAAILTALGLSADPADRTRIGALPQPAYGPRSR